MVSLVPGTPKGTPNLRQGAPPGVSSVDGRPNAVTQTPGHGIRSNHIINHHYLTQRTAMGDDFLKEGQLAFIFKNDSPVRVPSKSYVLLNLPMLNYHLASDAQKSLQSGERPVYQTAAQVLDKWCPQGIIVSEVGSADSNGMPQRKQCRIINCTVAGWANTFNIWGGVADGDFLFLTLKQVEISPDHVFTLSPMGASALSKSVGTTGCTAWQFIPTTSKDPFPSSGECRIQIGRVFRSTRVQPYSGSREKMHYDLRAMCQHAPQFEILFDVHRPRLCT